MKFVLPLLVFIGFYCQAQPDTLMYNGTVRTYAVGLPNNFTPSISVPLVINMHGLGSAGWQQALYTQFDKVADTANFVVVYPDGIANAWNSGFSIPYHSGVDDVGFISALIDKLHEKYNIDLNRVYATGMSNGGFMSYRLACELSNRIAAIASVTGSFADSVLYYCNPQRTVPVMHIHGTADPTVPYYGGPGVVSAPNTVQYWVQQNHCQTTPVTEQLPDINALDSSTVTLKTYTGCDDSSEVIFYTVNGGEHTWPGALFDIGITNRDMSASKQIWLFFKQYSLQGRDLYTSAGEQGLAENTAPEIFPNPAGDQINVKANLNIDELTVFNMMGQIVWSKKLTDLRSKTIIINTSALPRGIYVLRAASTSTIHSYKFIKE